MTVFCDNCGSRYAVDDSRIPPAGLRMRCPKCDHTFQVKRAAADKGPPAVPAAPGLPRGTGRPGTGARGGAGATLLGVATPGDAEDPDLPAPKDAAHHAALSDLPAPKPRAAAPPPRPPGPPPPALPRPPPTPPTPPTQTTRGQDLADLPAPKSSGTGLHPGRPSAAGDPGFGEIDLPVPKSSSPAAPDPLADLPMVLSSSSMAHGASKLPLPETPVRIDESPGAASSSLAPPTDFGEIDLPIPFGDQELPMPSRPPASRTAPLAAPKSAAAPPATKAPPSRGAAPGSTPDGLRPLGAPGSTPDGLRPLGAPASDLSFGEIDLGAGEGRAPLADVVSLLGAPHLSSTPSGVDLLAPRDSAAPVAATDVGQPGVAAQALAETPSPGAPWAGRLRGWRAYTLIGLGAAAIAGAVLSYTPAGVFGSAFIARHLPGADRSAVARAYIRNIREYLASDTASALRQALAETTVARRRTSGDPDVLAYAAFLNFYYQIRFGNAERMQRSAAGLMMRLGSKSRTTVLGRLATAAADLRDLRIPRALSALEALRRERPRDPEVLQLLGEAHLLAGQPDPALAAFQALDGVVGGAPRARFGIVRALLAKRDGPGARRAIEGLLSVSPHHPGGLLERARLAWQEDRDATRAVGLARQVIEFAARASDAELARAHVLVGETALGADRPATAQAEFEEALRRQPRDVAALCGMGEVLYRQHAYAEARARFETAMAVDPDSFVAKIGAAKSMIAMERLMDAKQLLDRVRASRPDDPQVLYWTARTQEQLGNREDAEAKYRQAIQIEPAMLDAYLQLSRLLVRLNRADEAGRLMAQGRAQAPDTAASHRRLGMNDLDRNALDEAERELRRALLLDGADVAARFALGQTLRRARRGEDALAAFEEVARADPNYPGLDLERGQLLEQSGRASEALATYQRALAASADSPDLILRVGAAAFSAGNFALAEQRLGQVLTTRPNDPEANYFMGRTLLSLNRAPEAMRYLTRAVDLDGSQAAYHLYFGWAALDGGAIERAEEELTRAIELDPTQFDAYWKRGEARLRRGLARDARDDLERAVSHGLRRAEVLASLGDVYDQLRDLRRSIRSYEQAIALDPNHGEWHYKVGVQQLDSSLRRDAVRSLRRGVELGEAQTPRPAWLAGAYRQLADAHRQGGERRESLAALQRYLEIAPQAPDRVEVEHEIEALTDSER